MPVKPIQSVERALRVLEAVAEAQPVGVGDLARSLDDDKSAVQRALVTLAAAGWIEAVPEEPTRWVLSNRPLVLAVWAEKRMHLRDPARMALEALQDETGETALFAVLDGHRVVVVDAVESTHMLRTTAPVGMTMPDTAFSALGRAILSALPADEVGQMSDIGSDDGLASAIAAVRRRGWAEKSRDAWPGVVSVAAPVLRAGRPIGAIGVTAPASRVPTATQRKFGTLVATAAAELSHGLS